MKKPEVKKEKYVTEKVFKKTFSNFEDKFNKFEDRFESSARATAKSFADNAETMAKSFTRVEGSLEILIKEVRTIHEDNKYFRQSISDLNTNDLSSDRKIENLKTRAGHLEMKVK